jgi:hypothetical protein
MVLENFLRDVDILWDRVGKSLHERPDALVGRKMRVQVVNASIVEDLTGYALNLGWKSMSDETKFGLDAFTVVDATKGIFELEYTSGMLSNYGSLRGTLQLVPPVGNTVESNNFGITVKKSAIDSEAIQSETSFTALTIALVSVQNLESTYAPELLSVKQQLADIELNKANIADLPSSAYTFKGSTTFAALPTTGNTLGDVRWTTDKALNYAWTGTAWTPIGNGAFANGSVVNSKLANGSVSRRTLDATLGAEFDELFPPDPNPNAMEILNSTPVTVSYFGNAPNTSHTESIVNGIKTYSIDTTAAYAAGGKPYISIGDTKFDVIAGQEYNFSCDVDQTTAKGIFTFIITNGTNTLSTQYSGIALGDTVDFKSIIMPAGATKLYISLFGFNVNINGEHHLKISNLQLKTVSAQDPDIITRTETLETTVGTLETDVTAIDGRVGALENVPQKTYFILDFDYSPAAWTDLNIAIVLDEFGYPFKFNYGLSSDPVIARSLVRRGCEMATYFNDAAYLPTTEQFSSAVQADIGKVDAYVKGAINMQEALGFKDQLVWSTRQFATGINLENALKKYGFAIERLRTSGTMLPTSFSKNKLTKIYVSDNTTNWYAHTMTGIDTAIANGGSLAIFTHKIVPTDDASGINIIESQYRLILNKIKGYVDAGQAEVVTYKQYFEMFSN